MDANDPLFRSELVTAKKLCGNPIVVLVQAALIRDVGVMISTYKEELSNLIGNSEAADGAETNLMIAYLKENYPEIRMNDAREFRNGDGITQDRRT
jgi:hypothetical protein